MDKHRESEIAGFWEEYKTSGTEGLKSMVEERYYAFFLNTVPPGSGVVNDFKVERVELFVKDLGRIVFSLGRFRPWLAVKKDEASGRWRLTLDERRVLEKLTAGWVSEKIGNIRFHTTVPLTAEEMRKASVLVEKSNELEKIFGYSMPELDYYSSPDNAEIAARVIGETDKGAGNARYRMIKAVNCLEHTHELAHVFALEIGYVGPFIDEGLATAFGSSDLVPDGEKCEKIRVLLKTGIPYYLNGSNFFQAHLREENVYGLAQIVMRYWYEKFGIEKVKLLLRRGVKDPLRLKEIVEEVFEETETTSKNVQKILDNKCGTAGWK